MSWIAALLIGLGVGGVAGFIIGLVCGVKAMKEDHP